MAGARRILTGETITALPTAVLHSFPGHPFQVRDDDEMMDLAQSVQAHGVLVPILVRSLKSGGYEIISGHRRKRACELAEVMELPVVVRELSDDDAIIVMVDSNLQRERIFPSERAKAYKMKLEALKRQGARTDLTSRHVVGRLDAAALVGKDAGISGRQVQRYVRLAELTPELLTLVDSKKVAVSPAIELSYLNPAEQEILLDAMSAEQAVPSLSQAQRLKQASGERPLTFEAISEILSEEKKGAWDNVTLQGSKLRAYFPESYTPQQMEQTIWRLLQMWQNTNVKKVS